MTFTQVTMAPLVLMFMAAPTHARLLRARATTVTRHPVEDVISLLKRLDSQANDEGKSEEVTFQKFEHWCVRSTKTLHETIAKEKTTLEALADEISAQKGTIDTLSKQIDSLVDELSELEKAGLAADSQRGDGESLYNSKSTSFSDTIQALKDAIGAMTTARGTTEPELLQHHIGHILSIADAHLSDADRSMLVRARNSSDDVDTTPRPALRARGDYEQHIDDYAFKSHGVIELLKKLLQDFQAQLVDTVKAETNAINAHNLAKEARTDATGAAQDSKTEKGIARGDAERALGEAQTAQSDTNNDLIADASTLGSTEQACRQKAAEWAERSKVRSQEREALNTAVAILAKVSGVRTAPPENPVLPVSPVQSDTPSPSPSFLQLPNNLEVKQALELLRQEAKVSHSKAIAELAAAVAANSEGPFDQVINAIEKMVFHLQNEQREEDDHKNWCDKELEKTNATIIDKEDKLEELDGKIEVAKTRANMLLREIGEADTMVNTIVAHVKEAAEIRKTGREENALAIKDAEAAQTALTQAIAVLTTFYKSTGAVAKESWEFIQQRHTGPVELEASPETWEGKYTSVTDPNSDGGNGVLKLLESVLASFSSMESDTVAQEESDQHAYEQDVKSCKIEKARRTKESETKALDRKNVLERQRSLETTLKRVSSEKDATEQYLRDLQPACVDGDLTYEDRKSARSTEITALKEAKDHLHSAFENITSSEQ